MSVKPTRTTVISVATATTLLVAGAAAATIGTSYRHVTIEVDGVSRDVSGFFTTAGDALNTAGVSVGDHDLVAPAADQTVSNGDTVVVRTATPYDVTVDGSQTVRVVHGLDCLRHPVRPARPDLVNGGRPLLRPRRNVAG